MDLTPVIGLEIHVQLKTASKMFCACRQVTDDAPPNSAVCSVCTGQPGALPVTNRAAIEEGLKVALALGATIAPVLQFDRKNYFYPDLPKGYQITQHFEPLARGGRLEVASYGGTVAVSFLEQHLEEDAAKSVHQAEATLLDFNRAGAPLLELVTEPTLPSPAAARAFLAELKLLLRTLGVSDADMEKGQLRVDANVSLRPAGTQELHPKTEVKNMNSFRAVERALTFELARQQKLWETGTPPTQPTTRGWDDTKGETVERREKELSQDYRYLPEPDLPPLAIDAATLERLKGSLPELPALRRARFQELYGLKPTDAAQLVADAPLGKYFEEVVTEFREHAESVLGDTEASRWWEDHRPKATATIAQWLINRISREHRDTHGFLAAHHVAHLLWLVYHGDLTLPTATKVYEEVRRSNESPEAVVARLGLRATKDAGALAAIVAKVIVDNEKQVEQYHAGKEAVLRFLIGKVMQAAKGTADAESVTDLLKRNLKR